MGDVTTPNRNDEVDRPATVLCNAAMNLEHTPDSEWVKRIKRLHIRNTFIRLPIFTSYLGPRRTETTSAAMVAGWPDVDQFPEEAAPPPP
jgi:hypothetical protein